ncbi:CHAD domain-containing protein [uncultured Jatrophihabitans sp.]|uniref:CYTH and CHAD domain-containing protein n=1 Tax=uncultured Jatrophihabitans sp. TaxID=1610747 RepID=UPI0035CA63C3
MKPSKQQQHTNKFEIPDGPWTDVDLSGVVPPGGSLSHRTAALDTMYYDTADFGLLRARLALRRRSGDEDAGWLLTLPAGDAPTELHLPIEGRGVPAPFRQLTLGVRSGQPLRAVARVRTQRDVRVIHGVDGSALVELVLKTVTATRLGSTAVMTRWREIAIDVREGDHALLKRVSKQVRKAGAIVSASSPTLTRALGDAAPGTGAADDGASAGADLAGLVRTYLNGQHDAVLAGDLALRREQGQIHATRVAIRRYRSVLKVLADVFDTERASALDAELRWYSGILGAVRDLQVLGDHLRAELADLPQQYVLGPVSARLEQTLTREITGAQRTLSATLRGRRYLALLAELQTWSVEPPLIGAHGKPARRVERYLRSADRKLERRLAAADRLPQHDPNKDAALHRARRAAKRARYTAELSRPVLGKTARTSNSSAKKLQTSLGEYQDAVVATTFLRRLGAVAGTTPGENGFTFGVLLANEVRRAREHLR